MRIMGNLLAQSWCELHEFSRHRRDYSSALCRTVRSSSCWPYDWATIGRHCCLATVYVDVCPLASVLGWTLNHRFDLRCCQCHHHHYHNQHLTCAIDCCDGGCYDVGCYDCVCCCLNCFVVFVANFDCSMNRVNQLTFPNPNLDHRLDHRLDHCLPGDLHWN